MTVAIAVARSKKIMSLATEKLLTAVINDAHQQNKLREQVPHARVYRLRHGGVF